MKVYLLAINYEGALSIVLTSKEVAIARAIESSVVDEVWEVEVDVIPKLYSDPVVVWRRLDQ